MYPGPGAVIVGSMGNNLIPFNFSDEVNEAFTCGDCWHLARTMHLLAGYPVVTFNHFVYGPDLWAHAANLLPDGRIVDIEGIWSEKDWRKKWSGIMGADVETTYARQWNLEQWNEECDFDMEYPQISKDAQGYAQEIIAQL